MKRTCTLTPSTELVPRRLLLASRRQRAVGQSNAATVAAAGSNSATSSLQTPTRSVGASCRKLSFKRTTSFAGLDATPSTASSQSCPRSGPQSVKNTTGLQRRSSSGIPSLVPDCQNSGWSSKCASGGIKSAPSAVPYSASSINGQRSTRFLNTLTPVTSTGATRWQSGSVALRPQNSGQRSGFWSRTSSLSRSRFSVGDGGKATPHCATSHSAFKPRTSFFNPPKCSVAKQSALCATTRVSQNGAKWMPNCTTRSETDVGPCSTSSSVTKTAIYRPSSLKSGIPSKSTSNFSRCYPKSGSTAEQLTPESNADEGSASRSVPASTAGGTAYPKSSQDAKLTSKCAGVALNRGAIKSNAPKGVGSRNAAVIARQPVYYKNSVRETEAVPASQKDRKFTPPSDRRDCDGTGFEAVAKVVSRQPDSTVNKRRNKKRKHPYNRQVVTTPVPPLMDSAPLDLCGGHKTPLELHGADQKCEVSKPATFVHTFTLSSCDTVHDMQAAEEHMDIADTAVSEVLLAKFHFYQFFLAFM